MINNKTILNITAALSLSTSTLVLADDNRVYASVNGNDITNTDVSLVLKDPRIKFETLPAKDQKKLIDQLIDKKLLSVRALKSDVVNSAVYKSTLAKTIEVLKQDLALQIWMQNISNDIKVKQNDVKKYYNENKARFVKAAELKASHILLKTKDEANKVINILKKTKNIKEKFTSLAKEKSTGPSGKSGGELGWFTKDKMVASFSKAADSLKVGTFTTTPVKSQFGFHVIYLDDKKPSSTISYNDVKNDIKNFLGQTQLKTNIDLVIKNEKSKAKITYK
jgi:parvulin-like peptidyl-prolyl isomerase